LATHMKLCLKQQIFVTDMLNRGDLQGSNFFRQKIFIKSQI